MNNIKGCRIEGKMILQPFAIGSGYMYCRNCGNEIKEGSSFCGKCGLELLDKNNTKNKSQKRKIKSKRVISILLGVAMILAIVVMVRTCYVAYQQNRKVDIVDCEQLINKDFFGNVSVIEQATKEAVSFDVKQIRDEIIVIVRAPNICAGMIDWIESINDDDFNDEAMEKEILRLLKESPKKEVEYVLGYTMDDGILHISYTVEFSEAMSCGLTQFYFQMYQQIF